MTAYDPYGNVATGYTGTVDLTSSDGQAVLPASYTFIAADAGSHTFAVTLDTAGTSRSPRPTRTIRPSTAARRISSSRPRRSTSLEVAGFPAVDTAGVAGTITVTAVDAYGNTVTGYTGTVDLTSTDPQADFQPASYTFIAADDGKHTFTVTLDTAGTQSITATDANDSSITGSETNIVVQAAGPRHSRSPAHPPRRRRARPSTSP